MGAPGEKFRSSKFGAIGNACFESGGVIDRHWDGIAAYCKPQNKVSLGFVEWLNNKFRVIQRRAYARRDVEYLRLKILTCVLPPI